jgi:septal ring factor EnvC (AmiA/AmiB activator)
MMQSVFGRAVRLGLVVGALAAAVPAGAQERDVQQRLEQLQRQVEELRRELAQRDTTETAVLRRQIEAITRELEEMRLG